MRKCLLQGLPGEGAERPRHLLSVLVRAKPVACASQARAAVVQVEVIDPVVLACVLGNADEDWRTGQPTMER